MADPSERAADEKKVREVLRKVREDGRVLAWPLTAAASGEGVHHSARLRRCGDIAEGAEIRGALLLFNNRARDGAANRSVGAFADVKRVATCPEQLPGKLSRGESLLTECVHIGVVSIGDLPPAREVMCEAGVVGDLP